jgi:glutaryl-CoA dehydrogenase
VIPELAARHPLAGVRAPSPDFFDVQSLLAEEERAIQQRVRRFAEDRLRPAAAAAWERGEFQRDLLPELGALGIVGGSVGHHGCPAIGSVAYGLATMELARVDSSFATFFGVHSGLAMGAIGRCGSEEQRQRFLPAMARCEAVGAFALTEPGHGSDAARLETCATRDGDWYRLDGAKRWIGNATICDVAIVWARAEDGIAGFLVECPTPGFIARPIEGKISKRASTQTDIELVGCRVPAANRMPVGGFREVAEILSHTRHNVAWAALGEAIACYEIALGYALAREQFGRPIAAYQLVQAKLVEMLAEITKAQLLVLQLGRLKERDAITPGMTAMAKANNAAMARRVAALSRELLGGNGILHEFEVMRHLVDLESVYTFEGTHEINTLVVGREITGHAAFS